MNQREREQETAPQTASIQRDEAPPVRQADQLASLMAAPGAATIAGQAAALAQASGGDLRRAAPALRQLQRRGGNAYVQRVVEQVRRQTDASQAGRDSVPGEAPTGVEEGIRRSHGSGQPLGQEVRRTMERSFGADFGDVRIHTGPAADALNRAISARAFTTGGEIFFRQGEYNPGNSAGRELLAHELAHVVQQTSGPKLLVGPINDQYERAADAAAREVMRQETAPTTLDSDRGGTARLESATRSDGAPAIVRRAPQLGALNIKPEWKSVREFPTLAPFRPHHGLLYLFVAVTAPSDIKANTVASAATAHEAVVNNPAIFQPGADIALNIEVAELEEFVNLLASVNDTCQHEGLKVRQIEVFSHGGLDGPMFGAKKRQFGLAGAPDVSDLPRLPYTGDAVVFFRGCRVGQGQFLEKFAGAQGVATYGFEGTSSFSTDPRRFDAWKEGTPAYQLDFPGSETISQLIGRHPQATPPRGYVPYYPLSQPASIQRQAAPALIQRQEAPAPSATETYEQYAEQVSQVREERRRQIQDVAEARLFAEADLKKLEKLAVLQPGTAGAEPHDAYPSILDRLPELAGKTFERKQKLKGIGDRVVFRYKPDRETTETLRFQKNGLLRYEREHKQPKKRAQVTAEVYDAQGTKIGKAERSLGRAKLLKRYIAAEQAEVETEEQETLGMSEETVAKETTLVEIWSVSHPDEFLQRFSTKSGVGPKLVEAYAAMLAEFRELRPDPGISESQKRNFQEVKNLLEEAIAVAKVRASQGQRTNPAISLAYQSTPKMCNIISYYLYGRAIGKIEPSLDFATYFTQQVKQGNIGLGEEYIDMGEKDGKKLLVERHGAYYGSGSWKWRQDFGMTEPSGSKTPTPITNSARRQELNDFLNSNVRVAITHQDTDGDGRPNHFLLIVKDSNGIWRNLDHTSQKFIRRGGETNFDQVYEVYFDAEALKEARNRRLIPQEQDQSDILQVPAR